MTTPAADPGPEFASDSLAVLARVGSTVVRRTGWWSPAVRALLLHLERAGFAESVRHLGDDGRGNEVLGFIEGVSGLDAWRLTVPEEGLRAYARLVRRYHDAVRDYAPAPGTAWITTSRPLAPGELITHGDLGPWNSVWRDGVPVGLLDWDLAGPRPARYDVAYALDYVAPFRSDEDAAEIGFTDPPDRAERIRVFAEAYGLDSTEGLVDAVIAEQESTLRDVLALAERGLEPHRTWVREGFAPVQEARIAWSRTHRHLLE